MSSNKDLQGKLVYMSFGGMIAIVGLLFGVWIASPVTPQGDQFSDIECSRLRVVDEDGKTRVIITASAFGTIQTLPGYEVKGRSRFELADGHTHIWGSGVSVDGGESWVSIVAQKYGGRVVVGSGGKGQASLDINEYGNGAVSTWDKNGYQQ